MNIIIRLLLFSLLIVTSAITNALPVKTVYRADLRTPDDVFNNGLRAWGTSITYISHILGVSGMPVSRDSALYQQHQIMT